MTGPDVPEAPNGADDLHDVRGEPEPGWVEEIRRGRRRRAERLKAELAELAELQAPADRDDPEAPP
jgi:hypothetical protein